MIYIVSVDFHSFLGFRIQGVKMEIYYWGTDVCPYICLAVCLLACILWTDSK